MNYNALRKLTRSLRWQTLYARAKEIGSLKLFNNATDLSKIQILVLQWSEISRSLYEDLAMDKKYISEKVIEDDLRTEAYLLWRRNNKDKKIDNNIDKKDKAKSNNSGRPSIIFTKRSKK